MDNLNLGPLGQEARIAKASKATQCKSRMGGIRCQKMQAHKGQHGAQTWRLVRSARWD